MFSRGHQPIPTSHVTTTSVIKTIFLGTFIGIPAIYYTYVEVSRSREIKRRRIRYESKKQQRAAKQLEAEARDESNTKDDARKAVTEDEYDEIKELYAPCVIGGRYVNALGPEWREQGAWEWIAWKLIWAPLKGTLLWNAGVPADPVRLAESLPVEKPNFKLLFGIDEQRTPIGPNEFDLSDPEGVKTNPLATAEDLSSSWDRLSSSAPSVSSGTAFELNSRSSSSTGGKLAAEVGEDLTATWIGQSTTFVQIDGVSLITDPVFAHRTVDTFLAPPRLCPPPCPLSSLLSLQLVLVSHDHFDHVHPDDVKFIGDSAHWVVPIGMGRFLQSLGVTRFTELTWWQTTVLEFQVTLRGGEVATRKLNITATPAQHWSSRGPLDTNQSLWCSYVVEGRSQTLFHSGDTGYNSTLFKAIGRIFGPFDLALLPIGSYEPRWHMKSQHCNPEDAVKIHLDLQCRYSLAQHWGTWILSDEHYLEPPNFLEVAKKKWGVGKDEFEAVRPGRTISWSKKE